MAPSVGIAQGGYVRGGGMKGERADEHEDERGGDRQGASMGAIAVASTPTRNGPNTNTVSSAADSYDMVDDVVRARRSAGGPARR